jgi:protein FAM50
MGDLFYVENLFRDEQKKVKKRKKSGKATLSFALDDEGEGGGADSTSGSATPIPSVDAENQLQRKKFRKNPAVDTSFLPDREREEAERREREELRQQWLKRQEEMKQEEIEITYSYWDGSGHRKSVVVSNCPYTSWHSRCLPGLQCKKGDDIGTFLEKCRQQFPELRAVNVDNLMYIKVGKLLQRPSCLPELIATRRRISSYLRLVC